MNTGWICPKCGKVYGPHIDECAACNGVDKSKKKTEHPTLDLPPVKKFPWQDERTGTPFVPPFVWYSYTYK